MRRCTIHLRENCFSFGALSYHALGLVCEDITFYAHSYKDMIRQADAIFDSYRQKSSFLDSYIVTGDVLPE